MKGKPFLWIAGGLLLAVLGSRWPAPNARVEPRISPTVPPAAVVHTAAGNPADEPMTSQWWTRLAKLWNQNLKVAGHHAPAVPAMPAQVMGGSRLADALQQAESGRDTVVTVPPLHPVSRARLDLVGGAPVPAATAMIPPPSAAPSEAPVFPEAAALPQEVDLAPRDQEIKAQELESLTRWQQGALQRLAKREDALRRALAVELGNEVVWLRRQPLPEPPMPTLNDARQLEMTNLRLKLLSNVMVSETERQAARNRLSELEQNWQAALSQSQLENEAHALQQRETMPRDFQREAEQRNRDLLDDLAQKDRVSVNTIAGVHEEHIQADFAGEVPWTMEMPPVQAPAAFPWENLQPVGAGLRPSAPPRLQLSVLPGAGLGLQAGGTRPPKNPWGQWAQVVRARVQQDERGWQLLRKQSGGWLRQQL